MKTKILGLLAVGLLAGATAAPAATVSLLNNGSFESTFLGGTYCRGTSSSLVGNWIVGDPGCSVTTVAGITPLDGNRMLRSGIVPDANGIGKPDILMSKKVKQG